MSTDFRALCAELLDWIERDSQGHVYGTQDLITRARAALAQPEGEGPSDDAWWHELVSEIARVQHVAAGEGQGPRFDLAEAVARWCRPTPPVAPATPAGGLDVESLLILFLIGSDCGDGVTLSSEQCRRAATLLAQQAAPAPVVVPVAVSERP